MAVMKTHDPCAILRTKWTCGAKATSVLCFPPCILVILYTKPLRDKLVILFIYYRVWHLPASIPLFPWRREARAHRSRSVNTSWCHTRDTNTPGMRVGASHGMAESDHIEWTRTWQTDLLVGRIKQVLESRALAQSLFCKDFLLSTFMRSLPQVPYCVPLPDSTIPWTSEHSHG